MWQALGIHDLWLFAATTFVLNITPGADMVARCVVIPDASSSRWGAVNVVPRPIETCSWRAAVP